MIVVSMTSIGSRIQRTHKAIKSILRGDVVPDRFVLNLSHDRGVISTGVAKVPESISRLGVDVVWGPNIGPAQKLIPTLREYWGSNTTIVVCDDDIEYPPGWLKWLVKVKDQTPEHVISVAARKIRWNQNGVLLPYNKWRRRRNVFRPPSRHLVCQGVKGVVYSPDLFRDDVLDTDALSRLAAGQDDLWFAATIKPDVLFRTINVRGACRAVPMRGPKLLKKINRRGGNDKAIAALHRHFGDTPWSQM